MKFLFNTFANNQNKSSISTKLRENRFALFVETLSVKPSDKILDVGGAEYMWINSGFENSVTLLNLKFEKRNPAFSYICADACDMHMIKDKEFDIVFSNSVIEHVGRGKKQTQFAKEVLRVGKKIWIQTPNKHFPIEPHFVFPFFQYFPNKIQKIIALKWPYSHYMFEKKGEDEILHGLSELNLLSVGDMKKLFDNSQIIFENFFGFIKNIIAVKNI